MAVDMIARMMAMGNGGGTAEAYTKAETDQLLDGKADLVDGKIPAAQLPSYVDDVLEYASVSAFPATGESGKIYVATGTNKTYRWSGTGYAEISESLALGETASTAYAGNKGKANADAIAAIKDGTNIDSFADVETALTGKADKSTTYTKAETDTLLSSKVNAETGKGLSTNDFTDAYKAAVDDAAPQSTTYTKDEVDTELSGKANSADLSTVATSGSYADLSNKPTIPEELADLTSDSTHRTVSDAEKAAWNAKSDFSGSYNDLSNKPSLGTAASRNIASAIGDTTDIPTASQVSAALDSKEQIDIELSDITESAADNYSMGITCGYSSSFAGGAGVWVVIRTYVLNAEASRKMQIVDIYDTKTSTASTKIRFYNGTWSAWV